MSKITVTTIAGLTSGGDANTVKIESGDAFNVVSGATTLGGDLTVDTNVLKVDASNNRVGVGTASPTSNLHVSGGAGAHVAIQSSAGTHWRIGDGVGSTNGNLVIYDYTDSAKRLEIDTHGHVTMPSQSAFLVTKNAAQSSLAVNTNHTITFDTERFDQNGDFASNTFTAPVTGRYQLNVICYVADAPNDLSYFTIRLVTSNREYYAIFDPGQAGLSGANAYHTLHINVLADMDANDTAYVNAYTPNGTAGTKVDGSHTTSFSGFLAC